MNHVFPDHRLLAEFDRDVLPPDEAERVAQHAIESDGTIASPDEEPLPPEFLAVIAEVEAEYAREPELLRIQRELLDCPQALDASWLEQTLADSPGSAFDLRDWTLPRRIDAYEIEGRLGRGGMGTVYRARHVNLKNTVALKILSPEHTNSPRALALFYREMEALGRLKQPNVVQALHAGQAEGVHFLAMELVDGIDVGQISTSGIRLRVCDACEIVRQAAQGLSAAHRQHLVHRDIKPSNLMITRAGRVKLLDLGLASVRLECAADTDDDLPVGTADYMAPEQWESPSAADVRADLYSLGCTLFKLLTGQTPFFEASTVRQKMHAHVTLSPPSLTSLRADVPPGLARIVTGLLSKRREDRLEVPEELAEALRPFCEGSELAALVQTVQPNRDLAAPPETTDQPESFRQASRAAARKWLVGWAALCGVLGLAILSGIVIRITDKGELTVTVDQPQATIQVGPHEVTSRNTGEPVTIHVRRGEHEVVITKPGFDSQQLSVRIDRGIVLRKRITLVPSQRVIRAERTIDLGGVPLAAVRLIPGGNRAVIGTMDGHIQVIDLRTQQPTLVWKAHAADDGEGVVLDVDSTGKRIVSGGSDGAVVAWDLETGNELRRIVEEGPAILCIKISPDGKRLITGGLADSAELWNLETYEHVASLTGHQSWVRDAAFHAGNRFAVTCGNDAMALVWDLATNRMKGHLIGHTAPVGSIDLTPDGRFAVTGSWDATVRVWDLRTSTNVWTMAQHTAPVRQVKFLDPSTIVAASEDHDLSIWNPAQAELLAWMRDHAGQVVDADVGSSDRTAVSASTDGTLRLWKAPTGLAAGSVEGLAPLLASQRSDPLDDPLAAWTIGEQPLVNMAIFDGGKRFAVVTRSGQLSVWESQAGAQTPRDDSLPSVARQTEIDRPQDVTSIAYGPDGSLAIGTRSGAAFLLAPGERLPQAIHRHQDWVSDVAFSEDGSAIASCGFDGSVRVWNIAEARVVATHSIGDFWLHALAVNGRDATLVYAGGTAGSVYAWRAGTDHPPLQYGDPFTWHVVSTVCASQDNRYVAAAGAKGDIRIWDNAEMALKRSLSTAASETLRAPPICAIAFTPDGSTLVAADEDGVIRLWQWSTGRTQRVLRAHAGAARGVAIAGDLLFSCGDDGAVRKWRLRQF